MRGDLPVRAVQSVAVCGSSRCRSRGDGLSSRAARILLADDHTLVREGVRAIINDSPDLRVVAEAGNGLEALELLSQETIDLVILDVVMPHMSGIEVAQELRRRGSSIPFVMMSAAASEAFLFDALRLGATAYIHKSMTSVELLTGCRKALVCRPAKADAQAVTRLVRDYLAETVEPAPIVDSVLTRREQQIVKLIAEGYSGREIANLLYLSPKTVERHRSNVLEKLGMRDRVDLTRFAIRMGLIEP
ncbi:MAG: response regulator transcription factor [Propionibacteriaceae bacterium]|nr:response regulator transcription factor [Propionibacteriaceae bacterium]